MGNTNYGIFFDGTSNNKNDLNKLTNVARLYDLYKSPKLYIRGVGSAYDPVKDPSFDDEPVDGSTLGAGFGKGAEERLEYAYQELEKVINTNEEVIVDIFGFSRGAAKARDFVNDIYKLDKVTIRFLGIFDTVGSFGLPGNNLDLGFEFHVDNNKAKHIYHIIAGDELRWAFDLQSIKKSANDKSANGTNPNFIEEEYPGVHSDIGGGYKAKLTGNEGKNGEHKNDNCKLAYIYLEKMHTQAKKYIPIKDIPKKWTPPKTLRGAFDHVTDIFKKYPSLYKDHKNQQRQLLSIDVLKDELSSLTLPGRRSPNRNSVKTKIRKLKRSISRSTKESIRLEIKIKKLLNNEFDKFTEKYKYLRDSYIHVSHAPYNTTFGMGVAKSEKGSWTARYIDIQRDIFFHT